MRANERFIHTLDGVVNALYGLDLLLSFRLTRFQTTRSEWSCSFAFVDAKSGNVVKRPERIAAHYIHGWFIFDLLVTIPWDQVVGVSTPKDAIILELIRIFRLARLTKILRLIKVRASMSI